MKQGKVIVQEKLVVGYCELTPMESGAELLAPQDTSTVRVVDERQTSKKHRNYFWTEDNWPRLKEALVNSRYPYLRGQCDENCLELGLDIVTKIKSQCFTEDWQEDYHIQECLPYEEEGIDIIKSG